MLFLSAVVTLVLADWEKISKISWETEAKIDGFFSSSGHTNNWAVLVDTSRFWLNYRHIANTLSMYRTVKRLGIPDSNIILMLADDIACNPRNPVPATVYNSNKRKLDLYGNNIEVDYRGYDVNVQNFIRLLTGRVEDHIPRSKRLLSDDRSNILVFMTGHGGEDFLKFQDNEELTSQDLADAFAQMYEKKRYHEILFMIDTCQAESMFTRINSPNIISASSSRTIEPSYSHHADQDIGVAVIDRFTYYNLEILEKVQKEGQQTIDDLFKSYNPQLMISHPAFKTDKFQRPLNKVLITDFFGGVQTVELTDQSLNLDFTIDHTSDSRFRSPAPETPSVPVRREVKNKVHKRQVFDLVPLNFFVGMFIYTILIGVSMVG